LKVPGRERRIGADLRDFQQPAKDYSPLTVHVWQTGGGKAGWRKRGPELIEGIVKAITEKSVIAPNERWLIVHHKPSNNVPDVPAEVTKRLPRWLTDGGDSALVRFVNWGRHMASNAYADAGSVILAGTLFMRPSLYTALTYLAQNKDVTKVKLPAEDIKRTTIGEHMDRLLQALCRGRVRRLDGDKCMPMDAYVIADVTSGIPAALATVFPKCKRVRWNPLREPATDHMGRAIEVVEQLAEVGIGQIPYKFIREQIALKDVKNWRSRIQSRDEWIDTCANLGYVQTKLKGGGQGLVRFPDAQFADDSGTTPEPVSQA
jgi:hypothetical protein